MKLTTKMKKIVSENLIKRFGKKKMMKHHAEKIIAEEEAKVSARLDTIRKHEAVTEKKRIEKRRNKQKTARKKKQKERK